MNSNLCFSFFLGIKSTGCWTLGSRRSRGLTGTNDWSGVRRAGLHDVRQFYALKWNVPHGLMCSRAWSPANSSVLECCTFWMLNGGSGSLGGGVAIGVCYTGVDGHWGLKCPPYFLSLFSDCSCNVSKCLLLLLKRLPHCFWLYPLKLWA